MSHVCPLCHEPLGCDAPEAKPDPTWEPFNRLVESMCRYGDGAPNGAVAAQEWPPTPGPGAYEDALGWGPLTREPGPVVDMGRGDKLNGLAAGPPTATTNTFADCGYFELTLSARPVPLYRVIWGRGPTRTWPMPWPAALRFVRAARKARPTYPITVVAVPLSPTHPEEP